MRLVHWTLHVRRLSAVLRRLCRWRERVKSSLEPLVLVLLTLLLLLRLLQEWERHRPSILVNSKNMHLHLHVSSAESPAHAERPTDTRKRAAPEHLLNLLHGSRVALSDPLQCGRIQLANLAHLILTRAVVQNFPAFKPLAQIS